MASPRQGSQTSLTERKAIGDRQLKRNFSIESIQRVNGFLSSVDSEPTLISIQEAERTVASERTNYDSQHKARFPGKTAIASSRVHQLFKTPIMPVEREDAGYIDNLPYTLTKANEATQLEEPA